MVLVSVSLFVCLSVCLSLSLVWISVFLFFLRFSFVLLKFFLRHLCLIFSFSIFVQFSVVAFSLCLKLIVRSIENGLGFFRITDIIVLHGITMIIARFKRLMRNISRTHDCFFRFFSFTTRTTVDLQLNYETTMTKGG